MSTLETAFDTLSDSQCTLKFDVVTTFDKLGGLDNKSYMGVVKVQMNQLNTFTYRVFCGGPPQVQFTAQPVLDAQIRGHPLQEPQSITHTQGVVEGTVTDTNNSTFTFPIKSLKQDYFVLVTHSSGQTTEQKTQVCLSADGKVSTQEPQRVHKAPKETFAIFYPSRILKTRKMRMKQHEPTKKWEWSFPEKIVNQQQQEERGWREVYNTFRAGTIPDVENQITIKKEEIPPPPSFFPPAFKMTTPGFKMTKLECNDEPFIPAADELTFPAGFKFPSPLSEDSTWDNVEEFHVHE